MKQHALFSYWNKMKVLLLCMPMLLLLAGCASEPVSTAALGQARAEYDKIKADPNIETNAPVASHEAAQALQRAEQATDVKRQQHLAYIAERKAQIAMADAQKSMADKEVQQLNKQKDQILIKSRELEAEKARREAEAARRQASQAEAELEELKAKQTERGIVLTLGDVLFATGKSTLMAGGLRTIDKLAEFLEKHPDRGVLIEGHTDSTGNAQFNMLLSQRRADAVGKALLERGITADRLTTKGYGESYPVAGNNTAGGRQQNRRVEVVVLDPGVSAESMTR